MKNPLLAVFAAGIWITLSEFIRNEFLFKSHWVEHYQTLGLIFATRPVNGILWMLWSFMLAYVIYHLLDKYAYFKAVLLSWLTAFVMMWVTVYNLQVLPLRLLIFAVPLSLFEVWLAAVIIRQFRQ